MATRLSLRAWTLSLASAALGLAAFCGATAAPEIPHAPPTTDVSLWRLDCGEIELSDLDQYSDVYLYEGETKTLTNSCYLVRNGDRYLLWDTGLTADHVGRTAQGDGDRLSLRATIRDQLSTIGVRPEQISLIGISHYHFDHTGQAADFPSAKLLIGTLDWEAVQARADRAARFRPWIDGGGQIQTVQGDHDVFGDGRVMMLATPGHTPGHHSLLVRLPRTRPVLLTGDVFHSSENMANEAVPGFNTSRAESLASMARLRQIARNVGARIIIQHEESDVRKLPLFPAAAR